MISGIVQKGEGKAGRYYGVPTANLRLEGEPGLLPGVYAGQTTLPSGEVIASVICYGAGRNVHGLKFEVHLIGLNQDLANATLSVEVGEKISQLMSFGDGEQMKKKIEADVAAAKRILGI